MIQRVAAGGLAAVGGWGAYQAVCRPLQLVWDLDHTLLCSVHPVDPAGTGHLAAGRDYFDQIDDDFEFSPGQPNTRTCWRPGARSALWLLGHLATQHVYTAAQQSYTENILAELDPTGSIFASVTHRDIVPHHEWTAGAARGKQLLHVVPESALGRTVLFDDKVYNFEPQPPNGVHVRGFTATDVEFGRDVEMVRLVGIAVLALLAPDVRSVLVWFQSPRHARLCEQKLACVKGDGSEDAPR